MNTWTEETGITRTRRENILLYLYQEGGTEKRELQKKIRFTREQGGQDFKFLGENGYVKKNLQANRMSNPEFLLTEKGEEFVRDSLLGGNPPQ